MYIKNKLSNQLSDKFNPLKKYWLADTPRGICQDAIDFVEILLSHIFSSFVVVLNQIKSLCAGLFINQYYYTQGGKIWNIQMNLHKRA